MSRSENRTWNNVLVLPAVIFFLIILSSFLLLAYRGTVLTLLTERQMEARIQAMAVARDFEGQALPRDDQLAQRRGSAQAIAVLNNNGDLLVVSGEFLKPATLDLDQDLSGDTVSGTILFASLEQPLICQVDLPARSLLAAARRLKILVPLVLAVHCALLLLVGLYLNRYMTPLDRLLRRARASGTMPAESDELDFLLRTFEDTLEKLAAPPEGDLDALERTLTKSIESGLLLLDEAGQVLSLNEIGAELLGVAVPPPGTPLSELLAAHSEPRQVLMTAIEQQQGVERRELTLSRGALSERRTLGLTLHPLRRDDGKVRGFLAFLVDLTVVRRQAEERELAESLARIGELSAGVAHEMRNSLATLRGYLTLIERGGSPEDISEYVDEIRHETDHLKRVVDDFLTFARPGSTRMESVDLERLLHRATMDPALGGMPVRIHASSGAGASSGALTEERPYQVHGDPQLLERALRNLLHNAARAEREADREGPLELSLEAREDDIELVIRDRGLGVPEDIRPRLFHPFVTQRAEGVGLGLALTHRILELHHGSVRLSDRPGGGTIALVRLRRESN